MRSMSSLQTGQFHGTDGQWLVAHHRGPDLIVGSLICDLDMVAVRQAFLHILSLL